MPLEDIAVIVIESREVTLTAPLLSALAQYGITLLTCDDTFTPCGQWLPFARYHRCLKILKAQLAATEPRKKQLWQRIVRQKIHNQAWLALRCGHETVAVRLRAQAEAVQSGDKANLEGQAAALYFKTLFGSAFHRQQDSFINAGLNYGYAILRSAIARALAQYGFLPALGLHHRSELNAFNLADDFIEPFRPIVDTWIITHLKSGHATASTPLCGTDKQQLIGLLHNQTELGGRTYSVLSGIDRCIQSFQASLLQKDPTLLKLPSMLPPKEHSYE